MHACPIGRRGPTVRDWIQTLEALWEQETHPCPHPRQSIDIRRQRLAQQPEAEFLCEMVAVLVYKAVLVCLELCFDLVQGFIYLVDILYCADQV